MLEEEWLKKLRSKPYISRGLPWGKAVLYGVALKTDMSYKSYRKQFKEKSVLMI